MLQTASGRSEINVGQPQTERRPRRVSYAVNFLSFFFFSDCRMMCYFFDLEIYTQSIEKSRTSVGFSCL